MITTRLSSVSRRLLYSPASALGAIILLFWILVAILAPIVAPHDPLKIYSPLLKPGESFNGIHFLLGTDQIGRDVLSRIFYGSRVVLIYGTLATGIAYAIGMVMGLVAGYFLGWIDVVLSRIGDIILSFPVLVLYVVIILAIGGSVITILLAVALASSPGIMRIVRSQTLELRTRGYVDAARTRGESSWYIIFCEILPNARGPLIVDACLRMGYTIITIGTLGFLGLGIPPPTPEWGGMIAQGRSMAMFAPHMVLFPAIAITSLVLALNLIADGLRETRD